MSGPSGAVNYVRDYVTKDAAIERRRHNVSHENESATDSASQVEEKSLEDIGRGLAFIMAAETLAKRGRIHPEKSS